jgi:hypothetical protein
VWFLHGRKRHFATEHVQFSTANSQEVLPLAEVAFEARAFDDLKRQDQATLDLLSAFAGSIAN